MPRSCASASSQFRYQVERRLKGELNEDQFKPLRLMNGLYLQLHAYMLRIAVPYGTLSAKQLRMLAHIARKYDKGYGHFTTRQNLQFNWPKLKDVPDILAELATVEMHAIQTSGNCIRNVTADHFAGAAADEIEDPRPLAEIIRQWSSLHPEFSFLPRKFKIAVGGAAARPRGAQFHDMAVEIVKNEAGETGYRVLVGGGMGRTPYLGYVVGDFVAQAGSAGLPGSACCASITRTGRRDNHLQVAHQNPGAHAGRRRNAPARGARIRRDQSRRARCAVPDEELARIAAYFAPPEFETLRRVLPESADAGFRRLDEDQHASPPRAGLRHRHDFAETHRRRAGRLPAPSRWTRWPI